MSQRNRGQFKFLDNYFAILVYILLLAKRSESVNAFYDAIAGDYNTYVTDSDRQLRESVKNVFTSYVPAGPVLDFGGGTGLDLPWLLKRNYSVYFLEPSVNMRTIARKNNPSRENLVFIEENTDFAKWLETHLPVQEKMRGVLANFAVLNSFDNLSLFFEKIALVAAGDCYIVATVIDSRPQKIVKTYSLFSAFRLLYKSKITIQNKFRGVYHDTYIHSRRSFIEASGQHFNLKAYIPLDFSGFSLLIFQRNEITS